MKPSKKKEILSLTYKNHGTGFCFQGQPGPFLTQPSMASRNNAGSAETITNRSGFGRRLHLDPIYLIT